jgi:hypothetical protein
MSDERKAWHVECVNCTHCWVGYYLPMDSRKVAEVMLTLRCPMCGSRHVKDLGNRHYRVFVEDVGCAKCGSNAYFFGIVSGIGDEGREEATRWNDRELAQDICDLMNDAYLAGKASRE